MNQEHKDLMIAAAKAAGIEIQQWVESRNTFFLEPFQQHWNPITSNADRWDLCERCGLTVDFEDGFVWLPSSYRGMHPNVQYDTNNDESQALAVLKAAIASKE